MNKTNPVINHLVAQHEYQRVRKIHKLKLKQVESVVCHSNNLPSVRHRSSQHKRTPRLG